MRVQLEEVCVKEYQTKPETFDSQAKDSAVNPTIEQVNIINIDSQINNIEQSLSKLFKVLHVYSRYETTTQLALPDEIGFFGLSLLGMTSVGSFQDRLQSSLKQANYYLNVIHFFPIFFIYIFIGEKRTLKLLQCIFFI